LNELWIIGILVFAAVVLGFEAAYWLISRSWQAKKSITRRLTLTKQLANRTAVLNALRAERSLFDGKHPLLRKLNDRLAQTGLRLDRGVLLLSISALATVLFLVWSAIVGPGLISITAAILSAFGLTALVLEVARQRRIARFTELLPDAIDVIVRGVRVGYPLPVALDLAAREMPDPIGTELGMTSDEITFGQDVRTAIENLYGRVGHEDLLFFVVAINVQNQTGGNLAEVLSRLSRLLRHRSKLRLKIRALSAEGRVSAVVLSLMPFILFGGIGLISPGYFAEVRNDPLVMPALIYGAISLLLGNIVMYRMVHFKF
jgi:tight adherence protein B